MAKRNKGALVQAPLPGASDLPEIEGIKPVGVVTKINGSGQRINRAMHIKERVVLLVEASVDDFGHKRTKDGVKRRHTLVVDDMYEFVGDRAKALLEEARSEYRKSDPQLSIDDVDQAEQLGKALRTDESGVVLTEAELAEKLAGDQAAVDELEAGRAKRRAKDGEAPWDDYDRLGVGPITNRLEKTDDHQLVLAVGTYEEKNKNRAGVLAAVTRRSAQLLAKGGTS